MTTMFRHHLGVVLAVVSCSSLGGLGCVQGAGELDEGEGAEDVRTADEPLYEASAKIWSNHQVSVCWEDTTQYATERAWVKSAVKGTWDVQSDVDFVGWDTCTEGQSGVHISLSDTTPHTSGLGTELDGMTGGMVLNFTFNNWMTPCKSSREYCIRAIAAHEFGHALGFAHEQNRPDTPQTCTDAPQGGDGDTLLGSWDIHSIMNYCNPDWNNDGQLSSGDASGVRAVYGDSTDVGVISGNGSCPADSELITIRMDDEDSSNANLSSGWNGAITNGTNTTFKFCRVRGSSFKPLSTSTNLSTSYAVLKLGLQCPNGSTEFVRHFDNEDDDQNNSWSAPESSNISPNVSTSNTDLHFCLFTSGATTMSSFPTLGVSYGVLAPSSFSATYALSKGYIYIDDEDSDNANSYAVPVSVDSIAHSIVSGGSNTSMWFAKVK